MFFNLTQGPKKIPPSLVVPLTSAPEILKPKLPLHPNILPGPGGPKALQKATLNPIKKT